MKVFYVGSGLDGCYNVRCLFPLQANGWDGDRTTFLGNFMTSENKAKAAQDAEVVVFHRPETVDKLKLALILKGVGKKIVFDNDDTYKDDGGFVFNEFMNKARLEKGLKTLNEQVDAFIKIADLVTCSTKFLAEEYKKLNDNVIVLPNCIDPFYFEEPLKCNHIYTSGPHIDGTKCVKCGIDKNVGDVVRIGITGSVAITSDMQILRPIVEHYHKDKRVKIVLLSMPPNKEDKITRELYSEEYKFWESVDIEWQPFVPANEYYDKINELRLDMVIIPRHDNLFNRCKSNLKFLENSMLEIPTIAQSFHTHDSPYEQDPEDSKYLILATDHASWIENIEKLINDKELRVSMGKKAREYVENKYSIEKNAYKWVERNRCRSICRCWG